MDEGKWDDRWYNICYDIYAILIWDIVLNYIFCNNN
jgi:hypothetical protein